MNRSNVTNMMAVMLGIALAGSAVAQQEAFQAERKSAKSCSEVDWNTDMTRHHPTLIDACQEVVSVDGENWARFAAKFVRVESDGDVIFSVRDQNDRSVEEVVLEPNPGQTAYIDGRATPFSNLRSTDSISLYVPEGQYGFATQPGVSREQVAKVRAPTDSTRSGSSARVDDTNSTDRTVARNDTRRSQLPTTAGPLPWLVLAGLLSMLAGLGLTLRRKA
ncbi:MAG: LPXTG cell wall anchor domain-containing protein [Woeseia sp.]